MHKKKFCRSLRKYAVQILKKKKMRLQQMNSWNHMKMQKSAVIGKKVLR